MNNNETKYCKNDVISTKDLDFIRDKILAMPYDMIQHRVYAHLNRMASLLAGHKLRHYDIYAEMFVLDIVSEPIWAESLNSKPISSDHKHYFTINPSVCTIVMDCIKHLLNSKNEVWLKLIPGVLKTSSNILLEPVITQFNENIDVIDI